MMDNEQLEEAARQLSDYRMRSAAKVTGGSKMLPGEIELAKAAGFIIISDDRLMGCIAPGSVVEAPYQVYRNSVAVAPPAVCGDKPSRPGPMECEHVEGGVAGGAPRDAEDEAYQYLRHLFESLAPQCAPLPDLMGICTQVDNAIAGLREQNEEANKKQIVRLMAERDALKVELADCRRRLGERDASLLRAVGRR